MRLKIVNNKFIEIRCGLGIGEINNQNKHSFLFNTTETTEIKKMFAKRFDKFQKR